MSTEPTPHRAESSARVSWSSIAFIVESILLLMFLVASFAVLTQTFAAALNTSVESRTRDAATIAAGSIAERFSANPAAVAERTELGDLLVTCDVVDEPRSDGMMHHATISVYDKNASDKSDPIYTLQSARYESWAS